MVDIKDVVKELRRIADAGERIAKVLEKKNRDMVINTSFSGEMDAEKIKQMITNGVEEFMENRT